MEETKFKLTEKGEQFLRDTSTIITIRNSNGAVQSFIIGNDCELNYYIKREGGYVTYFNVTAIENKDKEYGVMQQITGEF